MASKKKIFEERYCMRKIFASQFYSVFHSKLFVFGVLFTMLVIALVIFGMSYIPDTQQPIDFVFDDEIEMNNLKVSKLFAQYNIFVHEGKDVNEILAQLPSGTMIIGSSYEDAKRDFVLNDYWINHFDEYKEYVAQKYEYSGQIGIGQDFNSQSRKVVIAQNVVAFGSILVTLFAILVVLYQSTYDIRRNIVKNYVAGKSTITRYFFAKWSICVIITILYWLIAVGFCLAYNNGSTIKAVFVSFYAVKVVAMTDVLIGYLISVLNFALFVMTMFMVENYLSQHSFKTLAVVGTVVIVPYLLGTILNSASVSADILRFIPIYNLFNYMYGFEDIAFWVNNIVVDIVIVGLLCIFACRQKIEVVLSNIAKRIVDKREKTRA